MKTIACYCLFLLACVGLANAQVIVNEFTTEVVKATEFSIPSSPAFVMLDAAPDRITKPGLPRNFKVDWSLKSYSLAPNLSLEAEPFWLLLYDRAPIEKYQRANALLKTLSTISLSAGTMQRDTINWLAIAGKMNIYRSRDPLTDAELIDLLNLLIGDEETELVQQMVQLKGQSNRLKGRKDSISLHVQKQLNRSIDSLQRELIFKQTLRKQTTRDLQQRYVRRHWNTSYLDVAFGKSFKYAKEAKLDSLELIGEATSLWVSGSVGIGRNWLVSSMAQYNLRTAGDDYLVGLNVRYGSGTYNYNFFVESYYELFAENPDFNALTISYGGDFKIGRNVLLSYAIRTQYSEKLQFRNLLPIANVICLMR